MIAKVNVKSGVLKNILGDTSIESIVQTELKNIIKQYGI